MSKQKGFKIEKLYLDCIDDMGNCFIIYWVKAEFFLMKFVYSGLIFCNEEGLTTEKSTLKKIEKPLIEETLHFNNSYLKTEVKLERSDNAIVIPLYKDDEDNVLVWNCHHPKALAEIIFNGNIYKGFGYAETLFSTIKPWNLPIDELRWGRFLSDSCTLIWISWKGKYPVNKMLYKGIEYSDAIFGKDDISFGDGSFQLKFSDVKLVRKGRLSSLFSKMQFLKIFINHKILNSTEIKYKAKTNFSKNSVFQSNGWSLFEIVTWGK